MGVRVAYTLHPEKPDPANPVAAVDLLPQRQHGVRLGVKHLHVDYSSFVFGRSGQAQFQLDGHIEIFGDRVAIPKLYDYPQQSGKDRSARLLPDIPTTMEPPVMSGLGRFKGLQNAFPTMAEGCHPLASLPPNRHCGGSR